MIHKAHRTKSRVGYGEHCKLPSGIQATASVTKRFSENMYAYGSRLIFFILNKLAENALFLRCSFCLEIYILNFNRPRRDHVGHVARSAVGQLAAAGRNRVDITACSVPLSAVTGDARPRWSVCPFIYGLHCTVVQSQHASDSNAISACRSSLTHTRAHHLYRLTVATYWHIAIAHITAISQSSGLHRCAASLIA